MLTELYVENFGLIDKSVINFGPGFNVLTGETGAGKSLIIDAVGLLMGGRGSHDFIRTGTDKLILQGLFEGELTDDLRKILTEAGFDLEDNSLMLNREISRAGKNVCRINFRVVPLSLYKEIGKKLINIHGQHEQVNLLEDETQLILLDNYGGQKVLELLEKVQAAFLKIKTIKKQLEEIEEKSESLARKEDYLKFQINEINEANLQIGEDISLEKERKLLQNAEKISSAGKLVYEKLYGGRQTGACDIIRETAQLLKEITLLDENAEPIFEKLNEINFILEDTAREFSDYVSDISSDPYKLDEIEQRFFLINKLKKKYGAKIEEILDFSLKAKEELNDLTQKDSNLQELALSLEKAEEEYHAYSKHLSDLREKAGKTLSEAVTKELHELHMKSAQFRVSLKKTLMGPLGIDKAEFMVSPNFGEEMKPVVKIASGGELSRIMLGIKVVLSKLDRIPTLIFDEIDSGLGGKAINDVGRKLKTIANNCQVICVTHSPVIAAFADQHLKIAKERKEERTVTQIQLLQDQEIVLELCRMLAGENISEVTISQAKELLKFGHNS